MGQRSPRYAKGKGKKPRQSLRFAEEVEEYELPSKNEEEGSSSTLPAQKESLKKMLVALKK